MKADSLKISRVFSSGGDVHYFLPHFQREYAWEKTNWQTLLDDVLSIYEAYDPEKELEHFMGSLVVINDGTRNGTIPAFKLVDGQQRLTTVSLLLCALGRLAGDQNSALKRKIHRLLTNPDEDDLLHFKLMPTIKYGDRDAYFAILENQDPLPVTDSKIPEAFQYLYSQLEPRIAKEKVDPERLFVVISNCLQVVFIDLNQNERPYEIFESLNAKGKPLSQADLVRNYIAMKLPEDRQNEVFNKYWSKVENLLQEKRTVGRSRLGELTAFLRHYLAMQSGMLINEGHVYARFRDRVEEDFKTPATFEQELAKIKQFSDYYDRLLRPENETDPRIRLALQRLNTLEISTAYPFLLAVYEAVDQGLTSKEAFLEGLRILENYIVRRYIAQEPTNYLNKMFPTLWREVDKSKFAGSLRQILLTKNYPSDNKVRQAVVTEPIYDKRSETRAKIVLILESVNRFLSEKILSGGYTVLNNLATIEHIMPQTLDGDWKKELGVNWEQTYSDYLDTFGNLTLVTQEWNSGLSNSTFTIKKSKLSNHALRLNNEYFSQPLLEWNEQQIRDRAEWLANQVLEIWPALGISQVVAKMPAGKPVSLTVIGQTFTVNSWRDVAYHTAQSVDEWVEDFDAIANQFPAYFDKNSFKNACRQLSNGWWIYLNLSAASVKSLCKNLIAAADIPETEWLLEEE